jgi:hypothetical protein
LLRRNSNIDLTSQTLSTKTIVRAGDADDTVKMSELPGAHVAPDSLGATCLPGERPLLAQRGHRLDRRRQLSAIAQPNPFFISGNAPR